MPSPLSKIAMDVQAQRQRVLSKLRPDEALLVFGAPLRLRNGDTHYPYRQDSTAYWLTGWSQPQLAVWLRPGQDPFTLFVQPRDPEAEVWTGSRPGPEGAIAQFGADAAFPYPELGERLPELLVGVRALHHDLGRDPEHDALVMAAIAQARRPARNQGLGVPTTIHTFDRLLYPLRLIKQPHELAVLRRAATLTETAHRAAMAMAAPGVYEYHIEAVVQHRFRRGGGVGPGYPSIVAGGPRGNCLHYLANDQPLRDGELLLLDAGAEVSCYTADVTRTFPVNGRFTKPQKQVYSIVLAAQQAAIQCATVGHSFDDIHQAAVRVLTQGLVSLGLLHGDLAELIHDEAYKAYYPHRTGHWLGLDVHDVGPYTHQGASRPLEPGMVLTVEPGLYIPEDDDTAPQALRGMAIRIEDDVVITAGEPEVLTASIPKAIAQVEAACAQQVTW